MLLAGSVVAGTTTYAADPIATTVPTSCDQLEGVAHRGLHLDDAVDENTLAAFDAAIARGFSVETDVWPDAQDKLWVFHDENIARATGLRARNIDEMTSDEVAQLTYEKAGTPVLSFDDLAVWLAEHPEVPTYIEPKVRLTKASYDAAGQPIPPEERTAVNVPGQIAQTITDIDRASTTWVTAFNTDLHEERPLHPAFPDLRLLDKTQSDDPTAPEPQPQPIADAGFDTVALRANDMDPRFVERFHELGIRVQGANSTRYRVWRSTFLAGADAQLSNNPAGALRYCRAGFEAPMINRFSPRVSTAPVTLRVRGTGFRSTTQVRLGRRPMPFRVDSNRVLRVRVTRRARGLSRLRITNQWGTSVSDTTFRRVRPG